MKHLIKTVALTAAVALTLSASVHAKESRRAQLDGNVNFFLTDPELGVAGEPLAKRMR